VTPRLTFSLLLAAALILLGAVSVAAATSQRLMLASGCYVLEPGTESAVVAYCLDEPLPAPKEGVELTEAPASFGQTAVKVDGGPPMSLQAAMAAGIIRLEGVGEPGVLFRNMTRSRIELCILAPTVVAERGNSRTIDLAAKYDAVAKVLTEANPAGRRFNAVERRVLQQKVWQTIAKVDDELARQEAGKALQRQLQPMLQQRNPRPPEPEPPKPARLPDCDVRNNMLTLCTERR
jgi:hypothetical protein